MSKKTNTDFDTGMLQLRQEYVKRLSSQISEFRRYGALLAQGFLPARDAQNLYRLSHNLTGSGLTFGFAEISTAARQLNRAVGEYMDVDVADGLNQAQRHQHVNEQLQNFETVCRTAISSVESGGPSSGVTATTRRAGFFARKKEEVAPLASALQALGYEAVYAHSVEGLKHQMEQSPVSFWVASSGLTTRETTSLQGLKMAIGETPLFIVTAKDTFDTRLAALRLGAAGFSAMMTDMNVFAHLLDAQIRGVSPSSALRILIVGADDMLGTFCGHALTAADMVPVRANSAREAYELMLSQGFDLALINVDMPNCSGTELAQLMRQMTPPRAIPVIFITGREQPFGYEAETLLKKPFLPEDLVKKVRQSLKSKDQ